MADSIDKYEFLAERFRDDTGLMAPGKDAAPGRYTEEQDRERHERWGEWSQSEQGQAARADYVHFAHCAELAQRLWSSLDPQVRYEGAGEWEVAVLCSGDDADDYRSAVRTPGLAALEAALCVLAGEPLLRANRLEQWLDASVSKRVAEVPKWAVELAEKWRATAAEHREKLVPKGSAPAFEQCAHELLAAAKGGAR